MLRTASRILALQRLAGNRAVARAIALQRARSVVARSGPPVATTAFRPVTDFDTMTVGELDSYANTRPDWATDPALGARKRALLSILEFVRNGSPAPLGACDGMPVHDLETNGLPAADREKLRTYARGVQSTDTAGLAPTTVLAEALANGGMLHVLESKLPKATLNHALGTKDEGKAQLAALMGTGLGEVTRFADYFGRSHAYLEADNGTDVTSYMEMVATDSRYPDQFIGSPARVHNYHRFLAPMLTQLAINEGDRTRAKPLLLILHTGSDHNGAFRRDPALKDVVVHPRNLAVMVEGAASLEAAGGAASEIAQHQGQHHRIQQIMLAGHGAPQSMDLAGVPSATGDVPSSQGLDLATNRVRTERFLRGLISHMDSGPDARIMLNACLTAADQVTANLPADPALARTAILASLAAHPSLAGRIQQLAPGRVVEGNISSVPAGTYMEVDGAGNPTGVLHQQIPSDPLAVSSDLPNYIEGGQEPEGCMRAVVVVWARDQAECLRRVNLRRAAPITSWQDRVIHTFYDMVVADPDNANLMNRLANDVARGLSEFNDPAEQTPEALEGVNTSLSAAQETSLFAPLHPHAGLTGQLAMDQIWMVRNTARRAPFLTELDTFATTVAASPHLSADWLAATTGVLLPVASAATPTSAQMKLALWGVTGGRDEAGSHAFLLANATPTRHIVAPVGATVSGLTGGSASEHDVLTTLGLAGGAVPSGGSAPAPNFDTDGDGVNDVFIQSVTRRGVITGEGVRLRATPSFAGAVLEHLSSSTRLDVFGESGPWLAVDRGGRVGFVHRSLVHESAVP